ncbi:hypothetical protein F4861DRAFT_330954 [Xylaria intraflava]|nr:hypothetical protein F4861DRAFT_330954 [Xylaria intraflava]
MSHFRTGGLGGHSYLSRSLTRNHHHQHHPASTLLKGLARASFNAASKQHSPSCLENTRRNILHQIEKWADGDGEKRIYWLKGMAGTGKSTISLTIARKYHDLGRLGASFFFSRDDGDLASAEKFSITVAAQLAHTLPDLEIYINNAVTSDRHILELGFCDQWDRLVIKPLAQLVQKRRVSSPIIIVVDALDECDNEDDVMLLIKCFDAVAAIEGGPVRVFITSRPELAINTGFDRISRDAHEDFILHSIEDSIVDADLSLFYSSKLCAIGNVLSLDDRLLSDESIQVLVQKSSHLFIHAAIVCRYIQDGKMLANKRLAELVAAGSEHLHPETQLDNLYTIVLEDKSPKQADAKEEVEFSNKFKYIVGSIVVLFDVMTPAGLSMILETERDEVTRMLRFFHSVLDITEETAPIRLLHPSFRDFLLNPERCRNRSFTVDAKEAHRHLLDNCLRIMKRHLRCNLLKIAPATHAGYAPKFLIDMFLPIPIQYACRHWVHHLQQSDVDVNNHPGIVDFFNNQFLHWLEALSWLNRVSEGIDMIRELEVMLPPPTMETDSRVSKIMAKLRKPKAHTPSLSRIVHDARGFLSNHSPIIAAMPLQTYCSTILSSPEWSLIRRFAMNQVPEWIVPLPRSTERWVLCFQQLPYSHRVFAVAFSRDGRILASGSEDKTIRLWDATTGRMQRVLKGHSGSVLNVVFSPDSRTIASGSMDQTVRLWNVATGKTRCVLRGHSNSVHSIAFSPDGKTIATGCYRSIRLWDAATSCCIRSVESDVIPSKLSFDKQGISLFTGTSTILMDELHLPIPMVNTHTDGSLATSLGEALPGCAQNPRAEYGISEDLSWITFNDENAFYLPDDYQPRVSAVFGPTVAMGTASGKFIVIRFSANGPMPV